MPQVIFRYRKDLAKDMPFRKISNEIAKIVAEELSCEDAGGDLTDKDVEVEFRPFGPHDRTNGFAVSIVIDANDFPARKKNFEERVQNIARKLGRINDWWRHAKAYLWVRLLPASFQEIGCTTPG